MLQFNKDNRRHSGENNRIEHSFYVRPEDVSYVHCGGGAVPQMWMGIAGDKTRHYILEPDVQILDMLTRSYGFIRYADNTYVNPHQIRTVKIMSASEKSDDRPFIAITLKTEGAEPLLLFDHPVAQKPGEKIVQDIRQLLAGISEFDKKKELSR